MKTNNLQGIQEEVDGKTCCGSQGSFSYDTSNTTAHSSCLSASTLIRILIYFSLF